MQSRLAVEKHDVSLLELPVHDPSDLKSARIRVSSQIHALPLRSKYNTFFWVTSSCNPERFHSVTVSGTDISSHIHFGTPTRVGCGPV